MASLLGEHSQKSETPAALTQGYRERSFQRGGPVVKMYTVLRKSGSEFIEPNNDDDDDDDHHHHNHQIIIINSVIFFLLLLSCW